MSVYPVAQARPPGIFQEFLLDSSTVAMRNNKSDLSSLSLLSSVATFGENPSTLVSWVQFYTKSLRQKCRSDHWITTRCRVKFKLMSNQSVNLVE